jgi:hypothetical protein
MPALLETLLREAVHVWQANFDRPGRTSTGSPSGVRGGCAQAR